MKFNSSEPIQKWTRHTQHTHTVHHSFAYGPISGVLGEHSTSRRAHCENMRFHLDAIRAHNFRMNELVLVLRCEKFNCANSHSYWIVMSIDSRFTTTQIRYLQTEIFLSLSLSCQRNVSNEWKRASMGWVCLCVWEGNKIRNRLVKIESDYTLFGYMHLRCLRNIHGFAIALTKQMTTTTATTKLKAKMKK